MDITKKEWLNTFDPYSRFELVRRINAIASNLHVEEDQQPYHPSRTTNMYINDLPPDSPRRMDPDVCSVCGILPEFCRPGNGCIVLLYSNAAQVHYCKYVCSQRCLTTYIHKK